MKMYAITCKHKQVFSITYHLFRAVLLPNLGKLYTK